jgi:hypothetical protein
MTSADLRRPWAAFLRSFRLKRPFRDSILLLLLAWLLLAALPFGPPKLATGHDPSWHTAVNMARAKGFKFGVDLFQAVGPLGYLAHADPEYAGKRAVLAFLILTYFLLAFGVLRYVWLAGLGPGVVAAVVLVTLTLLPQHFPDAWHAAYMAVLLAAAAGSGRTLVDLTLSGLVAGFTLLLKLNEGLTACALFVVVLAYSVFRLRRRKWAHLAIALSPLAVVVAGMALTQGSWLSVFPYLRDAFDTVAGYTPSSSVAGPLWQSSLAVGYLALLFSVPALLGERSAIVSPGLPAAVMAAFAAFKHGMVRQDGHADVVMVKIAIAALLLVVACGRPESKRVLGALALFGAGFTACLVFENAPWLSEKALRRLQPIGMYEAARRITSFDRHWAEIQAGTRLSMAPLRLPDEFHQIVGGATIDAFPENVDVIRANGWNYRPRPGIQSSSSFTPRLDEWNATYLARGPASRYVLFVYHAIDLRHPFLQDPLTVRALLDNYEEVLESDTALLLERRSSRRFREPELIEAVAAQWDVPVAVPAVDPAELVMARVEVTPSPWGRIRTLLFRTSPVWVQVEHRSGQTHDDRVVSANLVNGAIFSPLPRNVSEVAALLQGQPGDPVVSLKWFTHGPREYQSPIRMSWYRIRRQDGAGS